MQLTLSVTTGGLGSPTRPRRRRTSSADIQLRRVLGLSASSQIIAYAVIVLYSFWLGGIDLVIPVKYGLLATIGAILYEPFDVLGLQLLGKPRATPATLGISLYRLVVEVFAAVSIFTFSIPFMLSSYSNVALIGVGFDVKLVASLGVGLPAFFAFLEIARASKLKDRLSKWIGRAD